MKTHHSIKTVLAYLWKAPLCAFAYMAGIMIGGTLVSGLGMKTPLIPEQADEKIMAQCMFAACLALAVGIGPVARRIQVRYIVRLLILAGLCYVCLGVNVPIEAVIFTNLEGMSTMAVLSILPCVLFAAVTALLFRPAGAHRPFGPAVSDFFSKRSPRQWAWRLAAAVCAFPVIYLIFGMSISHWVVPYYEQGQFSLTLPSLPLILLVQLLRSLFFLIAVLPIVIVWSDSRQHLAALLGIALFVLVGLFGLLQTYWLAPILVILHNMEILADSVAYAGVLALLFLPKGTPQWTGSETLAIA